MKSVASLVRQKAQWKSQMSSSRYSQVWKVPHWRCLSVEVSQKVPSSLVHVSLVAKASSFGIDADDCSSGEATGSGRCFMVPRFVLALSYSTQTPEGIPRAALLAPSAAHRAAWGSADRSRSSPRPPGSRRALHTRPSARRCACAHMRCASRFCLYRLCLCPCHLVRPLRCAGDRRLA